MSQTSVTAPVSWCAPMLPHHDRRPKCPPEPGSAGQVIAWHVADQGHAARSPLDENAFLALVGSERLPKPGRCHGDRSSDATCRRRRKWSSGESSSRGGKTMGRMGSQVRHTEMNSYHGPPR